MSRSTIGVRLDTVERMAARPSLLLAALVVLGGCGAGPFSSLEGASEAGASEASASGGEASSDSPFPSSTSTGDGDPTTLVFVPEDDTYDGVGGWCDPWFQDCPDAEKCVPYASTGDTWDANLCGIVQGEQGLGQTCVYDGPTIGTDDCDATTLCWNALAVGDELIGTCFEFCTGSSDRPSCTDALTSCRSGNNDSIALCLPTCDPLLQDCDAGLGCYWSERGNDFHCIRASGPGIPTSEPCGFNNDCAPGRFCADADAIDGCIGSACCVDYCELGLEPSICGMGTTCIPFFPEGAAPVGHADLGLCVAMATIATFMSDTW